MDGPNPTQVSQSKQTKNKFGFCRRLGRNRKCMTEMKRVKSPSNISEINLVQRVPASEKFLKMEMANICLETML